MNRTKLLRVISILMVVALLAALLPSAAAARQPRVSFWLTVLHNNDGESQLIDFGTGLEDFGGVARFKTLVDKLKWAAIRGPLCDKCTNRGVIMVSSGDNFLAGPEFNVSLEKGVPFYDTMAMDMIGYTAVAIGNHDFDFGPDVLADFIEGYSRTHPPYLSSNIDVSGEPRLQALFDQHRIARSKIVWQNRQKIGIIGAITPALSYISSPRNVTVSEDVADAVNAEVKKLRKRGVNKIILISHLQSIAEDLALAPLLNHVDVMVAGGGDEILADEGDLLIPGHEESIYGPYPLYATDVDGTQVPVVTTSGNYGYVGRLVVGFDKHGKIVAVNDKLSGPVRVAGGDNPDAVKPNPRVQAKVVDPLVAALADMAANVIGTSEVDLDGVRANVRTMETNEGNLVADSLLWQATELAGTFGATPPDVALQNGGGIRNDAVIPAGNITELDTFNIVPFANFVSIVESIPRAQFKEILENAVSRVEFVDGRFPQIAGFSLVYDPAGTPQIIDVETGEITQAGTRVIDVVLDDGTAIITGGVVVEGEDLTVATIDFLARGGDQYPFRDAPFTTLGVTYQQALRSYIETGLGGVITAADYPEGGEGRVITVP